MLRVLRNTPPAQAADGWDWDELRRTAIAVASQVLRSSQDAEDAAQEAVLRAWRARSRCQAAGSPRPWVGRIAQNEALRLGGRISERRRAEGTALEDVQEPSPDGDDPAGTDREAIVVGALRGLAPRDRELVRLRYVEDLQYSVIADLLELPLGTVKVRLHRVHAQLREATSR
jgi:RNA polymerase sigma-70 factor (ECF subfamily)